MVNGLHRTIDWRCSICPRFRERAGRRRLRFNLNGIIHLSRIGSDLFLLTRNSLVICANGITGRERSHFTLPSPFFPNSITEVEPGETRRSEDRELGAIHELREKRQATGYGFQTSDVVTVQRNCFSVPLIFESENTSVVCRIANIFNNLLDALHANSRVENSISRVHVFHDFWKIVRNESADGCNEHAASSFNNLLRPTRNIAGCLINRLRIGWLWSSSIDVG